MNKYIPLYPDTVYHLYNHANGSEKVFREFENYHFFLEKMKLHLLPVMDVYAYSLIPNHFHLVVKTKGEDAITQEFQKRKGVDFDEKIHNLSDFIMHRVGNLLNTYTKSYNKVYKRMGSLFMANTKRTTAARLEDVLTFIFYAHKNAVHHGLTKKIGEWKYDSYPELISSKPTFLKRDEVLSLFGTREQFIEEHQNLIIESKT